MKKYVFKVDVSDMGRVREAVLNRVQSSVSSKVFNTLKFETWNKILYKARDGVQDRTQFEILKDEAKRSACLK